MPNIQYKKISFTAPASRDFLFYNDEAAELTAPGITNAEVMTTNAGTLVAVKKVSSGSITGLELVVEAEEVVEAKQFFNEIMLSSQAVQFVLTDILGNNTICAGQIKGLPKFKPSEGKCMIEEIVLSSVES